MSTTRSNKPLTFSPESTWGRYNISMSLSLILLWGDVLLAAMGFSPWITVPITFVGVAACMLAIVYAYKANKANRRDNDRS